METFKDILFGISGVSLIFWVAVIGIWHVDMFPRFFKEPDAANSIGQPTYKDVAASNEGALLEKGSLRPQIKGTGLRDRGTYTRKSFVIADFRPVEDSYQTDRLYTTMLLSVGIMSFLIISYAFRGGLTMLING